jgi:hypothetical protein
MEESVLADVVRTNIKKKDGNELRSMIEKRIFYVMRAMSSPSLRGITNVLDGGTSVVM